MSDPASAPAPAAPLTYAQALERLSREARQGDLATSHYRCRYVDWGQGPALIFINGLGDEPRSFALIMSLLAPRFRCVAYHLPTGENDDAKLRRYRFDDLNADLHALLDHLKIDQATLAGHSFGAAVALTAMHDEPNRFPRGVLMNAFAYRPLSRYHWWLAALGRILPRSYRLKHIRKQGVGMRQAHSIGFDRHEPERWDQFMELTGESPLRSMAHFGHIIHKLDMRPLLPTVKQPTLLISGDSDPLVAPRHQEMLFQGLPNAVMFQMHRCGHLPMWTHPEALAGALLTFHGLMPPPGVHECGQGPDAAGNCPTTGTACPGPDAAPPKKEMATVGEPGGRCD